MIDYSKQLFRCSKLGDICTNLESNELTKGHITFVKKLHRELKYGRTRDLKTKEIEKGRQQEQDAVTLLSRLKGVMLRTNTERITNSFLSGTPDIYIGESIKKAIKGYDTKCPWSLGTFPFPGDKLDSNYYFQNMGYMALTGARSWTTAYCLVNAPGYLITTEKYYLSRAMGDPLSTDDEFVRRCVEIERNMIFDMGQFRKDNPGYEFHSTEWEHDIPMKERLIEFEVERDDNVIDKMYSRIKQCRLKLAEFAGVCVEEIV